MSFFLICRDLEKKKDPHGVSVTDKKDLEYSAFKQNILNKQSPHIKKPGNFQSVFKVENFIICSSF